MIILIIFTTTSYITLIIMVVYATHRGLWFMIWSLFWIFIETISLIERDKKTPVYRWTHNIWLRKRNLRCHKSSTNDFSINLLNLLEIPACMWVIHNECKWNEKWAINETTQRWYQAWVGVMLLNRDKHFLLLHNTLEHELVNLRFLSPDPGSFDALL